MPETFNRYEVWIGGHRYDVEALNAKVAEDHAFTLYVQNMPKLLREAPWMSPVRVVCVEEGIPVDDG